MTLFRFLLFFIVLGWTTLPSVAFGNELNYPLQRKKNGLPVVSDRWMVSAANPYAVEAGAKILAQGGSAADAMVAVQSVLGLVEPQSSGIGGGGFLIWFDAASGRITTLDGRETASRHVKPQLFQDESGQPLGFSDAVVGGRSVGVPGTPALMLNAHKRWGKLDWSALFQPGINLAEAGFAVSPRLSMLVARDAKRLARFERTSNYFYPGGKPIKADNILKNLRYAKTLRTIASDKGRSFYQGEIAKDIVAIVDTWITKIKSTVIIIRFCGVWCFHWVAAIAEAIAKISKRITIVLLLFAGIGYLRLRLHHLSKWIGKRVAFGL